ncbi:glycosyltransferase [Beijerinckia sp. L45]|uniref:glycosyltransferase family 2 protein n=1 Tax=Beijerinckia sp. L45 TaxID=1641855 RepID=UPI00131C558C|nr:glycosyltransferase [Beijerinckia sp. L45]
MTQSTFKLVPRHDVEARDNGYEALSADPWLTIDDPRLLRDAGRFVEITYRASFWDEPVRPVFRFETADGTVTERIAAGPVAGAGLWIGRIPPRTIRVDVSPTNRPGPFRFEIETIRRRSWLSLLALGFTQNPRSTRSAILTRLIGWGPESDINLAWAIGSTRLTDYPRWRRKRHRPLDLGGLDAPRFDWSTAPPIHLWIDARRSAVGLEATVHALDAQVFSRWTAAIISSTPLPLPDDARLRQTTVAGPVPATAGLVGSLRPGDRLTPGALACLAEAAHRYPDRQVFYGDEETETPEGLAPVFKPGWSRRLQQRQPFLGRAVFLRAPLTLTAEQNERFIVDAAIPDALASRLTNATAMPLRRVLLQTRDAPAAGPVEAHLIGSAASATIIIPTRDQPARLSRTIESIRAHPGSRQPDIVVIDNGSVERDTKRLFETFRQSGDVRVLGHPGPFNFSLMCNEGAASTDAEILVFLNDDTEALSPDWLDRLTYWALQPDIGAVGARLSYPDGRLQHIGVLLGMGDSAGHFGAFAQPDDPGWSSRHQAVHDVSAVTGACLAVARRKFLAVGGFDALNLPIELSDIDLCLSLAERGFATIVDPGVHLLHEESASRGGATFRRLDVYESQRAYFKRRRRANLRDDPFFHPGLSLYNWTAALA